MSGKEVIEPRWKRALSVPNALLSEAVGEMYVQKYFPPEAKKRMVDLVSNLQVALGQHIDSLEWMSDVTKTKAKEKLAAFHVKIGILINGAIIRLLLSIRPNLLESSRMQWRLKRNIH